MIDGFLVDLRFAARGLLRSPALTTALVLTIALGIASSASVEGFVRGLLDGQDAFPPAATASIERLLWTAAGGVFAMACANVAAFLLARAIARARETAVRVALGAGRRQLIRQAVTDSVLISVAGAVAGGVLAYWLGRIVPSLLFDQDADHLRLAADPMRVALVAGGCSVITIACGLLPLIEMRHDDPGAIMQRENAGPSRASLRIGAALVIAQMAACTLLIISSGLLYSGYRSSLQAGAGRRLSGAAIASVEATQMSSESQQATNGANYFGAAERAATELLAPTEIAWTAIVPGDRPVWRTFVFENTNLPPRTLTLQRALFTKRSVDRIVTPPLEGRLFGAFDSGDCGGVVLSAAAARQLGTGRVVGRSIETPSGEWSQVIGVARLRDAEDDALVFHYAPDAEDVAPEPLTYRVPSLTDTPPVTLHVNVVSSNYFDLLGLPLRAGRPFADRPDPCRVAIINEEAASRYFNGDAINGAIIDDDGTRTRIIGVVGSAKLRAAQRDIPPTVYLPMGQDFQPRMTMMMETGSVSAAALRRLHRRLALIPGGRENRIIVNTLDRHLSRTALAPERITTVLVGASASIALALGMLGLYGVMSDASRRRRRELALRLALGARGAHVARQVLSEGLRLVAIGALLGTAGSLAVARWIASIAPASDGPSAVVWMAIPLALLGAVGIASIVPARAAAAIDPLVIMRRE